MGRRHGLGGPWVLRGVDLDLRPGTLVRVQGTNGSGKSTLLRLLAGIVTAWLVRSCATREPPPARSVTAAAAAFAAVLGTVAVTVVALISGPSSADHRVAVPRLPATAAGMLTAAVCVLLGTAVGALCTRPLLHARGSSPAATALLAPLALVTSGSPAKQAVTGLVTGARTGTVTWPLLSLLTAAPTAAAAAPLASALAPLRGSDGGTAAS